MGKENPAEDPDPFPMIGVHGRCWIDDALSAFRDAGRSLPSIKGLLTLAPSDESGTVSSRRSLSSAEVGRALRAFLGVPEEHSQVHTVCSR